MQWNSLSKAWVVVGVMCAAQVALALPATAAPLDVRFDKFFEVTPTGSKIKSESMRQLMREISFALGPRSSGPIASQGALGVDFAYELGMSGANDKADYWQKGAEAPASSLTSHTMRFRKGLPQSLAVGASLAHLSDSSLYAAGFELQTVFIDGFRSIPEFGARMGGTAIFGNSHLEGFYNFFGDLTLSKSFGVAGVLALQPWLTYSMSGTYYKPLAEKIIPDDKTLADVQPQYSFDVSLAHRGAVGLRVVSHRVQLGFELTRSFSDSLNLFTMRVGAVF
ncbi:MAG: hypothetical protein FJ100_10605 [Deltaproteobacteria bacterium]|nr:hypothetical protein [Deltaproteobacteria bacterium]